MFCNKKCLGPYFCSLQSRWGKWEWQRRGLLHYTTTYIYANTLFWWINTNTLPWAILKQRPGILHLALIFLRLQMPMHRNHKTSSQKNANCTQEEDNKIARFCLLFKNKSDNSIPFHQESANIHSDPGCCNYPGRFRYSCCCCFVPFRLNISID